MEDVMIEIAKSSPTIAILLTWIYAERKRHAETLAFYRTRLSDCHDNIMLALQRHIDNEQRM